MLLLDLSLIQADTSILHHSLRHYTGYQSNRYEHITPFSATLHWLPVQQIGTYYTILCDTTLATSSTADYFQAYCVGLSLPMWHLSYLLQRCLRAVSTHTWTHQPASLCAADHGDLLVSSTKMKIGGRSFLVAAPTV